MWVYIPGTSSASAPDTEAPNSASDWRYLALAQSAWWRGKHSSSSIWLRRWKKISWTKRLFSRMLKPSTASLGVEKWLASLADIPAGRRGRGTELNAAYFADGVWHLRRQDDQKKSPTLFDLNANQEEADAVPAQ